MPLSTEQNFVSNEGKLGYIIGILNIMYLLFLKIHNYKNFQLWLWQTAWNSEVLVHLQDSLLEEPNYWLYEQNNHYLLSRLTVNY